MNTFNIKVLALAIFLASPLAAEEVASTIASDDLDMADSYAEEEQPAAAMQAVGYVPDGKRFTLVAKGPSPASELFKRLLDAEAANEIPRAMRIAQEAVAADGAFAPAHLALGRLQVKARAFTDAELTLTSYIEANPGNWESWYWLGTARMLQNNPKGAESALDQALNLNGEVPELWVHRSLLEQERGDYVTALQLLAIALELEPNHPQALLNVAYCNDALGNWALAQSTYRRFLASAHRGQVPAMTRFAVIKHLSGPSIDGSGSTLAESDLESK
ncbi:MAG: tetratricopeptide repeat protein [Gammaproteobacteria bacterium]|nr:tetratricopeptide repeat protein [Gammaproteobacteria bacterium]